MIKIEQISLFLNNYAYLNWRQGETVDRCWMSPRPLWNIPCTLIKRKLTICKTY